MAVEVSLEAERFKIQANEYFSKGKYSDAIDLYTKAINVQEKAVYYANRSFAYLKTELFGAAAADASKAIELDPSYIKGYYRRASANMAMGHYNLALKDFETVKKKHPCDKDACSKHLECFRKARMRAFAQAISHEERRSPLETYDPSQVVVESSYNGPHLPQDEEGNYTVTVEFMNALIETFKAQGKLHRKYAMVLVCKFYNYIRQLPSLVNIDVPDGTKFTVCGDIHGQFYDLINIFSLNGMPSPENPYLFNGDFVDRGSFSVECIFTLIGFKLLYPDHFFMSRGNHESENMNQMYGFENEVRSKYNNQMAEIFTEVFNWLPLAHLINGRVLTMHGGLFSSDNVSLDDLRNIHRNCQPPDSGLMCEILWSDPMEARGRAPSKRGVGCQFGPDVTHSFCDSNGLDYIIRSHEVKEQGYEVAHDGRCVTVFSAPNYCDITQNLGAFITLRSSHEAGGMKPEFTTFKEAPHPRVRPMAYANSLLANLL
ncbi:Serine/threonine-protein phosphatase 5 [Echinococcus granulosus]|uniref:protein-serine/threonine phosphatase n=1 Tax=Echinococcus granulosus TaxID=6210 RepID=U6JLB3_ECHGR|nr:Serine/threonine-protein phosphatase 5 [Echinococcus granulosus]EUB61432.1 Serine/threonine-protein phosphatase 5 [Echinococcus granulosus]KAH9284089.1 Serine/threonine-protein phosphatase 5 [Echinococcus granulosus]CDS23265.1 protein phosphatase 5 [Echinococcus granulosus]